MMRVSGCSRVPEPPARMTPFMGRDPTGAAALPSRRGTGRKEELPSRRDRELGVEGKHQDEHGQRRRQGDDQTHVGLQCSMDETIRPPYQGTVNLLQGNG